MRGNYALGLTVGVTNMFSRGSKAIQVEYKKLDSETKKMQRTMKDVADFKKASDSLERLGKSADATTEDIKRQERALNRLSRKLKDSGVNTQDLVNEQRKLEQQLKRTESTAKRMNKLELSMEAVTAAGVGGGAVATKLITAGMTMNRQESLAAAQTGLSREEVQASRNARLEIQKESGIDSATIMNNWIQALQSGYKSDEAIELAKTTSQLAKIAPQWEPQEILGAQMRMMRTYDISAENAADLLLKIFQKSGDDKNGLLDNFMEYTSLFSGKGLSLEALSAQFIAGKHAGVYSYDKIADANKEVFQARLTDPTEFAKLVGKGKQTGLIDEHITDQKTALELKNALFSVRDGLLKKENIDGRYATLMTRIAGLYTSTDPNSVAAAKIVAEGVGGTIYSEDIGESGLAAMAKAMSDPKAILGTVDGTLQKAIDVAITPTEKLANSAVASAQAASTAAAKLEYLASEPIDAVSKAMFGLADQMNGSIGLASGVSAGGILAAGLAGFAGGKLLKSGGQRALGWIASAGSGKVADIASGIGKYAAPATDVSKRVGSFARLSELANTSKRYVAGASKVVKPIAILATGASLAHSIYEGDHKETAGLAGNLAGGFAGLKAGAALGAFGGPVGVAIGGAAGGIIGSMVGEEVFSSLYDFFGGSDKEDAITKEINKATSVASGVNNVEHDRGGIANGTPSVIELAISAPITIESGAIVPDDFEQQVTTALRNASPELIAQLSQTIHQIITAD
ncbi:phage tail tape measure protein [Photobacterium damselae subsp. damselae]|uniref:phage tail tape measure protein n=1 Tax=Photobacterium damselae TaxID=38293 RepID=UPI001F3AB30C|nr:phage tail tape measure protein [Photobacterium damselae]UJZ95059.1 phage tail tape measure protein [Photobacterium damselae subsp. damselae]UJZ99040.1 phage tail tape measure protein [Photobacterium damselae subsp. damselae]